MKEVDMSDEAILRRVKTVDRLRELCLALMKAKKVSDESARLENAEGAVAEQDQTATPSMQDNLR